MHSKHIAIIGAGLSGLSLGYWLKKAGAAVTIFESTSRVGGCAGSIVEDGYVIERGPNSLLDNEPAFQTLIDELGLRDKVIYPLAKSQRRFIYLQNRLRQVPQSPITLLRSNLLGTNAKFKALSEMFKSFSTKNENETVYEFATRHFGQEIAHNVFLPAITGVFAGDAKRLSVARAFPKLQKMEKEHNSIIRGMMASKSKAKMFSFVGGTQDLIESLHKYLQSNIRFNTSITEIHKREDKWAVGGTKFDQVVMCTAPNVMRRLVSTFENNLPLEKSADRSPVVSLSLAFDRKVSVNGFGVLMHPDDGTNVLGILFPSDIFESRAPKGHSLLTIIMGGLLHPELVKSNSASLTALAMSELTKVLGPIPNPIKSWVFKYSDGITQYNTESVQDFDTIKKRIESHKGLYLNSHAYGGVSVNACILKSYELARTLNEAL